MTTDDNDISSETPGVESEDTITVTVDVPVDVLHRLSGDDLDTEGSMRSALRFWADMDTNDRRALARDQARQICDGGPR
jgi:hypothetical protein